MHGNNKTKEINESILHNRNSSDYNIARTHLTSSSSLHKGQDNIPKVRGYNQKLIIAQLKRQSD